MLGRPALAGLRAVVVRPDELVQEAVAPEQRVEQHLGVVRLAVVEVEVERAVVGEQAPRLEQARLEEGPVVVEPVVVGAQVAPQPLVVATVEPAGWRARRRPGLSDRTRSGADVSAPSLAAARSRLSGRERAVSTGALHAPGVERRIEVDQRERGVVEPADDLEVVALVDLDATRRPARRAVTARGAATRRSRTSTRRAPRPRRIPRR